MLEMHLRDVVVKRHLAFILFDPSHLDGHAFTIRVIAASLDAPQPQPHASDKRATGRTAGALRTISLLRRTIIPEVFAPHLSLKLTAEAETSRNSLYWTILRVTSLF
jgi:hypothetical protein